MEADLAVTPTEIILDDLGRGMPGITPEFGSSLAQAATICLEAQSHQSGVRMNIDGDFQQDIAVRWQPVDDPAQARRCWGDPQYTTEHGAYGVASLLVTALTDLTVVERSRKGTGFDYWLGPKNEPEPLFQNKARLEVSGIAKGREAEINSRTRQKAQQIKQSDALALPALVAVVEFGHPRSRLVRK